MNFTCRSFFYANQVRKQLLEIMKSMGLNDTSSKKDIETVKNNIMKCVFTCLPFNVANLCPNGSYYEIKDGDNRAPLKAKISHLSFLAIYRPSTVIFTKLTFTHKHELFMHNCMISKDLIPL